MLAKKIIARMGQMIIVLFVLSTITFILMKLAPGDPVTKILHLDVANVPTEKIEALREKLGFNDSLFAQWWHWLSHILQLDFGVSYQSSEPVLDELVYFTPPTLIIALGALAVTFIVSISLGTLAAKYYHTWIDTTIRILTSMFVSIPSFFLGIILIYFFSQKLNLLPSSGIDHPMSYVLPIISISIGMCAYSVRLMRSSLIELYQSKEVRASRLRGMSERYILMHDIFKPALLPIISILGLSIGSLVGGTVVIENLFDIPGIGHYLVDSIRARDYPVVQGAVIMIGVFVIIANGIADILILILDPKQRYQSKRKRRPHIFKRFSRKEGA